MWALRRVSLPLRNRGLSIRGSAAAFPDLEQPFAHVQAQDGILESPELASDKRLAFRGFYRRKHASSNLFLARRSLSSRAGADSGGAGEEEDDLEDGFSEGETTDNSKQVQDDNSQYEKEDELTSKLGLSEDDYDVGEPSKSELEISDAEVDLVEKAPSKKWAAMALVNAMIATQGVSIRDTLNKWVKEGNKLGRAEIYLAMLALRKLRMYGRALQFSEWLQESKQLEFVERDYSSHLDFIAKVRGLDKAEKYIDRIPMSFRGELVYRTLLANYVQVNNVKKAEEVFNKMKDLEFAVSVFACNQLLLLYKRTDKKKIPDVLLLMEKENLKPSLFTYKLLIDTKGKSNDIEGMEAILETMKAEGIDQDMHTKSIVAGHYVFAGFKEKAEAILKEMEGGNINENRQICGKLLELYAELGQVDEVARIWKVCKANPKGRECISAVRAWGKLKKIEEAEAVFEEMLKKVKNPSSLHFNSLLKVYADNKMLAKGKDLIKRMGDSGCKIGALAWDSLVKLYVDAGELEKADAALQKASQLRLSKPICFRSYMAIMDEYSKRGDIHNTEKIFLRMRQAGYTSRYHQFQTLVRAYINAKTPAYGMRERMKADNIFPNKALAGQLAQVDAFRKTVVSDLLD